MTEQHDGPEGEGSRVDQAKDKARAVKDQAEAKAQSLAAEARERGEEALDEGKEKARELGDDAGRMARSRAEEQKDRVSGGMRTMADALRHGTDQLPEDRRQYGDFLETVADRVERASRYLEEHDVDEMTREARRFARDHTTVFLGGAFALGLAGARFLKSSGREADGGEDHTGRGRGLGTGRGARPSSQGGSVREPPRTEEWAGYELDAARPYPRSTAARRKAERPGEEGGYA